MQLLICRNVEYGEGPRDWQNTFAEVSLYRGSLPYILLLLGRRISFVIPLTSLYSRWLNRGSTVHVNFFPTIFPAGPRLRSRDPAIMAT